MQRQRLTSGPDPAQARAISEEDVRAETAKLTGTLEQRPPLFSAKKVDGVKAYEAARKGQNIKLRTSTVTVTVFNVEAIRSEDAGAPRLGCGCDHPLQQRDLHQVLGPGLGRRRWMWAAH